MNQSAGTDSLSPLEVPSAGALNRDMPALPERRLFLEARDPSRNVARRYFLRVSPDLFGAVIVELAWGRIGTAGQERRLSFQDLRGARLFVRKVLRRRKSAPGRIGTSYKVVQKACR